LVNKREYPVYRQVPILGYRSDFCIKLQKMNRGPLECQEGIDLLRAIEHDMPLQIMKTQYQTIGVDTIDNLCEVEKVMESDHIYQRYRFK
jgi:3-deoxy-manno-octulosonate cytidylyltransferase (CMP-KDO synthetase)